MLVDMLKRKRRFLLVHRTNEMKGTGLRQRERERERPHPIQLFVSNK
jgi:hypothetical protein